MAKPLNGTDIESLSIEEKMATDTSQVDLSEEQTQTNQHEYLPPKKIYIMTICLCISLFLVSLDATIVSAVLPTIADSLGGLSLVSWVITASFLGSTLVQPIYGRLSDILGRKNTIILALAIFMLGSLISGVAKSMYTLIASRCITALGGAGVSVMTNIVVSEISPVKDRGKYTGFIGITFGISSVLAPLIGGIITDHISWHWVFLINLPLGAVAGLSLIFLLKIPRVQTDWREKIRTTDYLGMVLIVAGVLLLLLALNWGGYQYQWNSPIIISFICSSIVIILIFIFVELRYAKEPVIPVTMFKIRNFGCLIIAQLLAWMGAYNIIFYIPLYYTVAKNGSATSSGLFLLPFIIGLVIGSILSGFLMTKTGFYRVFYRSGTLALTVGLYLVSTIKSDTNRVVSSIFLLIPGFGIGFVMQSIIIGMQVSVDRKLLAVATSTIIFFRALSGAIGITVGSTVLKTVLKSNLDKFAATNPEYIDVINAAINKAEVIYESTTDHIAREGIINAYIKALQKVYLYQIPIVGVAFLLTMVATHIPLNEQQSPNTDKKPIEQTEA
ncbi:hypothetical protein BB558_003034 [Smittium angustum]|uniref:Major facilitator superfamily (MFS) profile domain-containing protein n=1 Tax=Smittium angustum TaxID=133377 RepID=A0A2U1IXL6_SMIAN|nr:hypothetical protein BB558_006570 [Smittium angustum]PWA00899.1 hypothetical protein BB558_003034 [Smittium angustum]